MKVFISWSGDDSRQLARILRRWLRHPIQTLDPWMSDTDIAPGQRSDTLTEQLSASQFGVICVTAENVQKPWLLFEAGALAKSVNFESIVPLLWNLKPTEVSGPLAAFQSISVDRDGIQRLLKTLADADPENRVSRQELGGC